MNVFSGGDAPQAALAEPMPGLTPAAPVVMGSFLEGPVGSKLSEADRNAAFKAISQALDSGDRRTWRGGLGVFGFVVPGTAETGGAVSADGAPLSGECRSFTQTIYLGGRPQTGHGRGCRQPDGSWRVVS